MSNSDSDRLGDGGTLVVGDGHGVVICHCSGLEIGESSGSSVDNGGVSLLSDIDSGVLGQCGWDSPGRGSDSGGCRGSRPVGDVARTSTANLASILERQECGNLVDGRGTLKGLEIEISTRSPYLSVRNKRTKLTWLAEGHIISYI